ncbi:MAG: hypothetical protein EP298_02465 [Gammaproteobacteria bacterium]|nr:MAG: hypothetical protein EP298_02465 [Gammaproteobacteria bacterium]UTW43450.1 hypothetical protein KFE69_04975 [bacterium SCSIO 12844]
MTGKHLNYSKCAKEAQLEAKTLENVTDEISSSVTPFIKAYPPPKRKKHNWGEKDQAKKVKTTSVDAKDFLDAQQRIKREGTVGSRSHLGDDIYEIRTKKGKSTERLYYDKQTGKSYSSRHDNIKEVKKRLINSRKATNLASNPFYQQQSNQESNKDTSHVYK